MRALVAVVVVALASSCWPGWATILDQRPSTEHIVEDLRVLAIVVEPAGVVLPPAVVVADDDAAVEIVARPAIFDPRPGPIDVTVLLGVVVPPSPTSFLPSAPAPTALPSVAPVELRVDAPGVGVDPTGALPPIEARFVLDGAALREAYALRGEAAGALAPVSLAVVVRVRREELFAVETETATVAFDVRVDPRPAAWPPALADARAGALASAHATECDEEEQLQCFADDDVPPPAELPAFCGDGLVTGDETCDPPGEGACPFNCGSVCGDGQRQEGEACDWALDEGCTQSCEPDPCSGGSFPTPPVCLLTPVEQNERPRVVGFAIDQPVSFDGSPAIADVDVGATVTVAPGRSIALRAALEDAPTLGGQTHDLQFFSQTCALPIAACARLQGAPVARYYVLDENARLQRADSVGLSPEQTGPINAGEQLGVVFTPPSTALVGDRFPIVVVAADGVGGMDLAAIVVEVR